MAAERGAKPDLPLLLPMLGMDTKPDGEAFTSPWAAVAAVDLLAFLLGLALAPAVSVLVNSYYAFSLFMLV